MRVPRPAGFDLHDYIDAWRRRDKEAILSHHADDCVRADPIMGTADKGKRSLGRWMETELAAMADLEIEPRHVSATEDQVAALVRLHAVYKDDMRLRNGMLLPMRGREMVLDLSVFLEIDGDGKIRRETWVFDTACAMAQLGVSQEELVRALRALAPCSRAQSA